MGGWAIVAIPEQQDPVWKISSEKVPHMTLLFLGEPPSDVSEENVALFLQHVASSLSRFGLSVDRRGVLGDKSADVLFFNKLFTDEISEARSNLLKNDDIARAYNSTEQYPSWTPHITLGYPETPALPDDRDYPLQWVQFDRIALWTEDYEGPEFLLKSEFQTEVGMSDESDLTSRDTFLLHYGVKGMKWGKRKGESSSSSSGTATSHPVASEDAIKAAVLKKKSVVEMSNAELRVLNERLQLERNYGQLMGSTQGTSAIAKGKKIGGATLKAAQTANQVYTLLNSPAAKAARNLINNVKN